MNCKICALDLQYLYDKGYVKDGKYYCTDCYEKYIKTGGEKQDHGQMDKALGS